jgi:hypothetical protein
MEDILKNWYAGLVPAFFLADGYLYICQKISAHQLILKTLLLSKGEEYRMVSQI